MNFQSKWHPDSVFTFHFGVQYRLQKLSHLSKVPKSELPLICFRDGSLPMPDFSDNILDSLGKVQLLYLIPCIDLA